MIRWTESFTMPRPLWLSLFLLFGLTLAFFHHALFTEWGHFISAIDIRYAQFWYKDYMASRLLAGELPLWNPHYYAGHPFIANPETIVFYPLSLLFVILPLHFAFTIDIVLHVLIAAWGMFFLMRGFSLSRFAALGSAIVYAFGGYMIDRVYAGHIMYIHNAAWLPWVFLYLEQCLHTQQWRRSLPLILCFSLLVLGGNPQISFYATLFILLYTTLRLIGIQRHQGNDHCLKSIAILGASGVACVLLCLVQLVPSLELAQWSDRSEASYEFSSYLSYSFHHLATLLIPDIEHQSILNNWEMTAYIGILALILVGLSLLFSEQRKRVSLWWFLGLVVFSFMLGKSAPFFQWYYEWVPGVELFRVPARALSVFVLIMAVLVGFGLEVLSQKKQQLSMIIAILLSGGVLFLWVWRIQQVYAEAQWNASLVQALWWILAAAFVMVLHWMGRLPSWFTQTLLLSVLFLDLWMHFQHRIPVHHVKHLVKPFKMESKVLNSSGQYRVAFPHGPVRGIHFGYDDVNGYTPIALGRYFEAVHTLSGQRTSELRRHALNIRVFDGAPEFWGSLFNVKYIVDRHGQLHEMESFQERFFFVENARIAPLKRHLTLLRRKSVNPRKIVLLEEALLFPEVVKAFDTSSTLSASRAQGDATIDVLSYEPEFIELQIHTQKNQYLVLSELFYPGWKAWIDGQEVPLVTGNFLLRVMAVPAGTHHIRIAYHPTAFYWAAWISLATALLWLILFLTNFQRKTP